VLPAFYKTVPGGGGDKPWRATFIKSIARHPLGLVGPGCLPYLIPQNWIFPKKVDRVKRKVSDSVFHIQPGKDTPALNAFSAGCRRPRYIQKWNVRYPDDLHSVHDRPARFS